MTSRWRSIRALWAQNQWLLVVSGWFLGILTFPLLRGLSDAPLGFINDLVPEAVGILFTVLIIDRLDAQRELQQLQNRLVREASGRANEMSKSACDWVQFEGWPKGDESLLSGKRVWRANMTGVDLSSANLVATDFYRSNLSHANMYRIDAQNANFAYADLSGADLVSANLKGANLEGALIDGVKWFHQNQSAAILPDGTSWTPETDMRRFTDHTHPDFWRSKDQDSQAWIGLEEHWSRQRVNNEGT